MICRGVLDQGVGLELDNDKVRGSITICMESADVEASAAPQ